MGAIAQIPTHTHRVRCGTFCAVALRIQAAGSTNIHVRLGGEQLEMNPTIRYELRPGEWRPDPPHVGYSCDRSGLVALLGEEQRAKPWAQGESNAGPIITVQGRALQCPATPQELAWLTPLATAAPYGQRERTLLDPAVRDARQIGAEHIKLEGDAWDQLRAQMLRTAALEMGLTDASLELKPLKLLIYGPGGHFSAHADTEKTPAMVASLALIVPSAYDAGALKVEHAGETISIGAGGAPAWRWGAWYADCRHWLERVEKGVRIALTFAIRIDTDTPLATRRPSNRELGWVLWGRSYAQWHTEWAARGSRAHAGREQYGQKMVWVLEHRYTESGLRANLLKGRDRELASVLIDEVPGEAGEACYLGWLQIREIGQARTAQNRGWEDETFNGGEDEDETEDDGPPESMWWTDPIEPWLEEPTPLSTRRHATPQLHLRHVARQNVWIEDLRSATGEPTGHGPIEVLDGELVPPGALDSATPAGARVYEATGNEGAALELQYRHAVLVTWRRNDATLAMLARCGGRAAIAVELDERLAGLRGEHNRKTRPEDVIALWREAVNTDGGGPEGQAHRIVLDTIDEGCDEGQREDLRNDYVLRVAGIDLDTQAVPKLVSWISERLEANNAMDAWVRALRPACGRCRRDTGDGGCASAAARTVRGRTNPEARHRAGK